MSAVPTRRAGCLWIASIAIVASCRDGCDESARQPVSDPPRRSIEAGTVVDATHSREDGAWHVTVTPAFAQGAIPARAVEDAIRSHDRALEACTRSTPMPDMERVRVMLRLSIGGDGAIFDVSAVQPRPESRALRDCVIQLVRAWTYPRSDAAATQALVGLDFSTRAM